MSGGERDETSSRTGRVLLSAALLLAAGATAMLILADDAKMLRLGIVASLWSALVGAFIAAKYRKQVSDHRDEAADLQAVYELELEREVAARREFELEVESTARRKADAESKDEMEGLRKDVQALRESLEALLGGEVLFERVALHAESTRMRSLPDEPRPLTGRSDGVRRITAARGTDRPAVDAQTEMIERVLGVSQPSGRSTPSARGRSRTGFPHEGSEQWFGGPARIDPEEDLAETIDPEWTPSWESGEQPEPGKDTARAARRPTRPAAPTGQQRAVAPPPRPVTDRSSAAGQRTSVNKPAESPKPQRAARPPATTPTPARQYNPDPTRRAAAPTPLPTPASNPASTAVNRPPVNKPAEFARPQHEQPVRAQSTSSVHKPAESTQPREQASAPRFRAPSATEVNKPAEFAEQRQDQQATRSWAPVATGVNKPAESRGGGETAGGGRRRAEDRYPDGPASGGGHRRAVDVPRVDEAQSGWRGAAQPTGSHHARVEPPVGRAEGGHRRAEDTRRGSHAPERDDDTGSHASGMSVSDLLAAHGQSDAPRRHRRRADDS